ncbi:MAG TPA: aminoglycoside phosphotransferase family protein [Puia sp.]|nr:aminoglycoside phosphotransferase family protein [Puia sp.]
MKITLSPILTAYGLNAGSLEIAPMGSGLINHTWIIRGSQRPYILQRINNAVFKKPRDIEENISSIESFLKIHHPEYLFIAPIKTTDGREMIETEGHGYFRMFPFVENSHTVTVVNNTTQAWEAANQFGLFTKNLSGFPAATLKHTLPDFHNLSLRYDQFQLALENGNPQRIQQTADIIERMKAQYAIVDEYKRILSSPDFHLRVTHHDTKISNVLFDAGDRGLCVIDLDTVMPGYFISDVGDMMRTYLSPVSEEESDFSRLEVREDFFRAIVNGYLREMGAELTKTEKEHFIYAGKFMIYMQALRFLTDHLNDDIYYGAKYEGHNLVRAGNQLALLDKLLEKQDRLWDIQTEESLAQPRVRRPV